MDWAEIPTEIALCGAGEKGIVGFWTQGNSPLVEHFERSRDTSEYDHRRAEPLIIGKQQINSLTTTDLICWREGQNLVH